MPGLGPDIAHGLDGRWQLAHRFDGVIGVDPLWTREIGEIECRIVDALADPAVLLGTRKFG